MNLIPQRGIRSDLAGVRRRRAVTRIAVGLLIVLLTTLAFLATLFGLDLCFHFSRLERAGLLVALFALFTWSSMRWMIPALVHRESEVQLALWIEREHPELRGLLANGLQFSSVNREPWGSHALEQAAVDEIALLDRLPSLVDPQSTRCGRLILASLLVIAAVGGVIQEFPEVCRVFSNRLLLGSATYPTRTIITRILVNGIPVFPNSEIHDVARIQTGEILELSVECRGVVPDRGTVHIRTDKTGEEGTLALSPVADRRSGAALDRELQGKAPRFFSTTGNRLLDDIQIRVRIGDALTEPMRIEAVPLPALSVEIEVFPPDYVTGGKRIALAGSPPQVSVPAGSRTEFAVRCRNKELESATLRIEGQDYQLQREPKDSRLFRLRPEETPLANVASPLSWELSAVDSDGFSLREPMRGLIGVIRDEPPRAVLSATTLHVLPEAEPSIAWTATDDHGVASVRLQWIVTGMKGSREGVIPLRAQAGEASHEISAQGTSRLPLGPLNVSIGDEVRLTLVAVDERGALSGMEGTSEPVTLHVTDEAGVLSALAEGDHKVATELDELIERQLRSGAGQ
jgi:hypothetical protein